MAFLLGLFVLLTWPKKVWSLPKTIYPSANTELHLWTWMCVFLIYTTLKSVMQLFKVKKATFDSVSSRQERQAVGLGTLRED